MISGPVLSKPSAVHSRTLPAVPRTPYGDTSIRSRPIGAAVSGARPRSRT